MTHSTTCQNHTKDTPAQIADQSIQLHRELTDIVRTEVGMREAFAADMAAAILRGLQNLHGGSDLYIPAPDKTARNAAIRATFKGTNADAICREHGISRARLYQIVNDRP